MKRSLLGIILLAATSAALAQALSSPAGNYYHPTRPYGVSGFLFFSAIAETKDESSLAVINKVRHITGVDDTTARGFLSYAKAALETLDMEAPSRNKEFCARRTEMNTLSRLAMAMTEADAALEQRRAQLVRGAESVLGREGMLKFEEYLSTKDVQKQRDEENYQEKLQKRNQSAEHVLTLICDQR